MGTVVGSLWRRGDLGVHQIPAVLDVPPLSADSVERKDSSALGYPPGGRLLRMETAFAAFKRPRLSNFERPWGLRQSRALVRGGKERRISNLENTRVDGLFVMAGIGVWFISDDGRLH